MITETPVAPDTWAIVELMGHAKYAGRLSEEEKFGSKLGRLDCPTPDGFTSIYFGGASVYKITIVTEAVARSVSETSKPAPVSPWDYPKQLAAPVVQYDESPLEDDDSDSDLF